MGGVLAEQVIDYWRVMNRLLGLFMDGIGVLGLAYLYDYFFFFFSAIALLLLHNYDWICLRQRT